MEEMNLFVPERNYQRRSLISILTPAFNEEKNLPELFRRLQKVLAGIELDWEWLVVDDSSTDQTFAVLKQLAREEPRLRGLRFSRNFGAHAAVTCALHHARGDCAVVMAADLQDPPEEIPRLLTKWKKGAQVVWAVRKRREGEKATNLLFSRFYYTLLRQTQALKDLPATGADFFLLDRYVIDAFKEFPETHVSIFSLINWMGFRQEFISYEKMARVHGRSGWNFRKKLKLVIDSITSFTYFPIRLMTYIGFIFALGALGYLGIVLFNALRGLPPAGWSSLMFVLLLVSGFQMMMLGILGQYLWRALDETRRRPRYIIGEEIGPPGEGKLS